MKKLILSMVFLLASSFLIAQEDTELQFRKIMKDFAQLRQKYDVEKTTEFNGIQFPGMSEGVDASIIDIDGLYTWDLLPGYYYNCYIDSISIPGIQTTFLDYLPNLSLLSEKPAFFGLWHIKPVLSLELCKDVIIELQKKIAGNSYDQITNKAETRYNNIPGWEHSYKWIFADTLGVTTYSHILYHDNIGYVLFYNAEENYYSGYKGKTFCDSVLSLVNFELNLATINTSVMISEDIESKLRTIPDTYPQLRKQYSFTGVADNKLLNYSEGVIASINEKNNLFAWELGSFFYYNWHFDSVLNTAMLNYLPGGNKFETVPAFFALWYTNNATNLDWYTAWVMIFAQSFPGYKLISLNDNTFYNNIPGKEFIYKAIIGETLSIVYCQILFRDNIGYIVSYITEERSYNDQKLRENFKSILLSVSFEFDIPIVSTKVATQISANSAILNGSVNPNGLNTVAKFEYDTTTHYARNITASSNPLSGTGAIAVSAQLKNLLPNTRYHFRVVAMNSAGKSDGGNFSFPTSKLAPTAVTNSATDVDETSATLNGTVNANNSSTTVKFKYWTATTSESEVAASPGAVNGINEVSVSARLTGLIPYTTYSFKIIATNDVGTTDGEIQSFTTYDKTPPALSAPTYLKIANQQTDTPVSINVTDKSGIRQVMLYYRTGGSSAFYAKEMDLQNDNEYQATIQADSVTSKGVEFYVGAEDNSNNPGQTGVYSIPVKVGGEGVQNTSSQPYGSEQTAYRLISLPLDLDDKSPKTVLEDDLGRYNKTKWRFFELRSNQKPDYGEYQTISNINPGEGFWLIVKDAGKTIDTGPGTSIPTNEKYPIALNPGWTFVGNPFNFSIPFNKLSLKYAQTLDIRAYDGSWKDASPMQPFKGYALANYDTSTVDTLFVDPYIYPVPGALLKETALKSETNFLWSIKILAQCNQARDEDNVAAVVSNAVSGIDELDRAEPPVIGEYVSVYFPHPEWGTPFKHYSTDARPEPVDGEVWKFEVKTNIRDKVNLTFKGVDNIPLSYEVWLIDEIAKISINIRENNNYSVAGSGENFPNQLKLVVGNNNFIEEKVSDFQKVPETYELSQNFPNPFNPTTTIRYGLPQAGKVTLKIYNLLGEDVVTLLKDEEKPAGYHVVIWDAKNQHGQKVANGIYIYQLRAGNLLVTKKMSLLK